MPQKATVSKSAPKGKLTFPAKGKSLAKPTLVKKGVPVKKDEDDELEDGPFIAEFARVKECATCDCFELDTEESGEDGMFFHRKNDPQRIYLKHAVLRATRVKVTVEVLETE